MPDCSMQTFFLTLTNPTTILSFTTVFAAVFGLASERRKRGAEPPLW